MPAPLIAAALGTIAPALAQRGLDLLSGVFRGALDKGTQEVADLIEAQTGIDINDAADNKLTDDQWARLKDFELQNQAQLLSFRQQADATDLELERLGNADRTNARDFQIKALDSDDVFARRFVYWYAWGVTILTFIFIFCAAFVFDLESKTHAARIVDTVVGFLLGTTLSAVIQYFYGSSAGSRVKTEKLAELAAGGAPSNPLRED